MKKGFFVAREKLPSDVKDSIALTSVSSRGSPVFDKAGKLVAVNYAGFNTTQSFNYGILAKYLKTLAMQ